MIVFPCVKCGAHQRAGEHLVGRMLRCQSCGSPMQIPAESLPLPAGFPRAPAVAAPAPTAAGLLAQSAPAAVAPASASEPAGDDDLFFEQIRKPSRRKSKYL
jgi:hypothetical protein